MKPQGPRPGIQPTHYHTPRVPHPQHLQQLMLTSKTLSRVHKTPRTPSTAHHSPTSQSPSQNQKADLLALGEWLRWAAVTLGVGKHVFDNAVSLLREGSQKLECTYALAAAALAIATKLQHGPLISKHSQLPVKPALNLPRVSLKQAIKVQGLLLNTLDFSIPVCDRKLFLLLSLTERWNRYLKRNSRHLNLPLHLVEAGLGGRWQKRNLTCAGYLLDILFLGAAEHEAPEQILLVASLATIGAANCCQPQQLMCSSYILVKFAHSFLKRCYQFQQSSLQDLTCIFEGISRNKLWQKLSLVPSDKQNQSLNLQTESQKLEWLNQLQFIPFSQQGTN